MLNFGFLSPSSGSSNEEQIIGKVYTPPKKHVGKIPNTNCHKLTRISNFHLFFTTTDLADKIYSKESRSQGVSTLEGKCSGSEESLLR
jgi:hypothetical protein